MNILLAVGALWLGLTLPLGALTLFDNSVNDLLTRFDPGTYEVGDEILLASADTYLTNFSFEFWGTNTASPTSFAGDVEARVTFYEMNGPLVNGIPTPGTIIWQSDWFNVSSPTSRSTFVFTPGNGLPDDGVWLPTTDITWSVQFEGMGATDSVGVDIYSPPVVGNDYTDYWQNDGTGWIAMTNTVPMDFAARLEGVPEPSIFALSLAGGGLLILARRLRRMN